MPSKAALATFPFFVEMSIPYKDIYNAVAEKKDINSLDQESNEVIISLGLKYFQEIKRKKNWSNIEIVEYICQYEPFTKANIRQILLEKIQ